jgi:hypothetical protein
MIIGAIRKRLVGCEYFYMQFIYKRYFVDILTIGGIV